MLAQSNYYLYGIKSFPLYITNYIYPSLYIKYKGKLYSVFEIEKRLYALFDMYIIGDSVMKWIDNNKEQVKQIIIEMIKKKLVKQEFENVSRVK